MAGEPRLVAALNLLLIGLYEKAATDVRREIRKAAKSNQMQVKARREKQLGAIMGILSRLLKTSNGLPGAAVREAFELGDQLALKGMGLKPDAVGAVNERAVAALAADLDRRLRESVRRTGRSAEKVLQQIGVEEVAKGVIAGSSRRQMTVAQVRRAEQAGIKGYRDSAGRVWQLDTYARMSARTRAREAVTTATVERMRDRGWDLVTISSHSNPCEEICAPFDGKTFSLSGKHPVFPKYRALPPFHPNAVTCGSIADTRGVLAGSKAYYVGPLVHLCTASGVELAVSPHHPMLTARGWLPAKLLRYGDHVLRGAFGERTPSSAIGEHLDHRPTPIEEVFDTAATALLAASVPATATYLHGDGRHIQGDIDVVGPNSELLHDVQALGSEHGRELAFVRAGVQQPSLTSAGPLLKGLGRVDLSSTIARAWAQFDANRSQAPTQGCAADWGFERERLTGFAGSVTVDELTEVRDVDRWRGHVYDLQTVDGSYFVNGLYTHNCEHVTTVAAQNLDPAERKRRDALVTA